MVRPADRLGAWDAAIAVDANETRLRRFFREPDAIDVSRRRIAEPREEEEAEELQARRFFAEPDAIAVSPKTRRLIAEHREMEERRTNVRAARDEYRRWRREAAAAAEGGGEGEAEGEAAEEEEEEGEADRLLARIEEEKGKAKRRRTGPATRHPGAATSSARVEEAAEDLDPLVGSAMMQPSYGLREFKRDERQTFTAVLMKAPEYHARDVVLNRIKRAAPHRRPIERRALEDAFARDHDLHSRAWEDAILRTPLPGTTEKPCAHGERCQGYVTFGDVLVECLTQREYKDIGERGDAFSRPAGRCLRCRRADVLYYYVALRAEAKPIQGGHFISDFYNLANARGEYLMDDCIVSGRGPYANLPKPVVAEIAFYYRREKRGEVVYHVQAGYRTPGSDEPGFA